MCLALYLFTDNQVKESSFDKNNPAMYVEPVTPDCRDFSVKNWITTKENAYYIGSSFGCGCGFLPFCQYEDELDDDDKEAIRVKTSNRNALYELLQLQEFIGSHIVACWEDDQGKELLAKKQLTLEQVRDIEFEFEELVDYLIE